jgi:hypothetical protein
VLSRSPLWSPASGRGCSGSGALLGKPLPGWAGLFDGGTARSQQAELSSSNRDQVGGYVGFRSTASTRPSRTSITLSGRDARSSSSEPREGDRNTRSLVRGSLVLLALAAVVIVGAVGCGNAAAGYTPAGPSAHDAATPAASRPSPTRTPTATHAPAPAAAPAPAQTPSPPPAPAPVPPPPAASTAPAAGCYPLSDEGTCYEPGEFCRDDDHGTTGVAGDGETIECEDNDGWRWVPVS